MKSWIFGAVTAVSLLGSGVAWACGPVQGDAVRPSPRPVQNVQQVNASAMVERAGRLESIAATHDASASNLDRDAETLAARARVIRNQANFVAVADRPSVLTLAEDLLARADVERARAADERAEASQLRASARALRGRAVQLVRFGGNGGGWNRGAASSPSPPSPSSSERSINL